MKKPGVPLKVSIETTNHCNYKCKMCYHQNLKRKKGFMSMDMFKSIVDECAKLGVKVVRPQYAGEPLIDSRFPEMLKYIHDKNLYSHISTTGYLLNEKVSREIIESGCEVVTFSFHGGDKQEYMKIHGVDGFSRCIENIKEFYDIRERLGSKTPKITIQFMRSDRNSSSEKKIIEMFESCSDNVKVTSCTYNEELDSDDLRVKKKQFIRKDPCFQVLSRIVVLVDGRVTVCCADMEGLLVVGHIKEGIKNIFNSYQLNKLRKRHLRGDFPEICKHCSAK